MVTSSQMQTSCAMCSKPLAPADVLYTAQAQAVCATCFERADVAAATARGGAGSFGNQGGSSFSVGVGGLGQINLPMPKMSEKSGLLIAGGIAGLVPFALPAYAFGAGAIAAVLGVISLVIMLRGARKLGLMAIAIAVVALGGYQLARAFGFFW
jgi:hypothetical protein